jgi:hypothetical protein
MTSDTVSGEWHVQRGSERFVAPSLAELLQWVGQGRLRRDDFLFHATESPQWRRADQISVLAAHFTPLAPSAVWYRRPWFHVVVFILMPYIQVIMMWVQRAFTTRTRVLVTVAGVLWTVAIIATPPSNTNPSSSRVESSMAGSAPAAMPETRYEVLWADRLAQEYASNEVAADAKYKGKTIVVQGTVDRVMKDVLGSPIVLLSTQDWHGVAGEFRKSDEGKLAHLREGSFVTLKCRCDGLFGNVNLSRCDFQ